MEPDAKVDNDIAMMMIKKRIEQTPLMIPTIQVLLERVELPGPYPVVLLDICDPRSTDRPVPGGAGFALVGRMFSKRKETIPTIQVLLERVELPGPIPSCFSTSAIKIDRPPGAGWCRVRACRTYVLQEEGETPSPPLVCRPVIAFERDYYSLNILIVPRDWRKDGEKLAGQIAELRL